MFKSKLKFGLLSLYYLFCLGVGSVRAEDATITFSFPVPSPNSLTISVGSTVTWNGPSSSHPLQQVTDANSDTAVSGGFSSTSSPFMHTFNSVGTFYYRCTNHGIAGFGGTMRGEIIVVEASTPTPTATPDPEETPTEECIEKPDSATLSTPAKGGAVTKPKVLLDWDDVECATSYQIRVHQDKKTGTLAFRKKATDSTYRTSKLEKGHTYFWSVKACNSTGCSAKRWSKFSLR